MDETISMDDEFETNRKRLHALAFRMLGSNSDADDAVQETWLRATRVEAGEIRNPAAWLTTTTARVCLNALRRRRVRNEADISSAPADLIVAPADGPEQHAELADAVSYALLVVLGALSPTERVAFVLHDMFAVPFDEIAPIVDRSVEATRKLASRARERVQGFDVAPDVDIPQQRALVDAFFAAARRGDLDTLIGVLDPTAVSRTHTGRAMIVVEGAGAVANRAITYSNPLAALHPVTINNVAGVAIAIDGVLTTLMAFTTREDRIVAIDAVTDPQRLAAVDGRVLEQFGIRLGD